MMNKPIVLSTGEWLFPTAQWMPSLHRFYREAGMREDDLPLSYVYKSSDNGRATAFTLFKFIQVVKKAISAVILSGSPPRFRYAILLTQNFDYGLSPPLRMTAAGRSRNT